MAFLLTFFAAERIFVSTHEISHQNQPNFLATSQVILQKNSGQLKQEKNLYQSFFEKIFHSNKKVAKNDCLICSFSSFQDKIVFAVNPFFFAAFFYLIFCARKFSRIKLSYLLSSFSSRAPPAVS